MNLRERVEHGGDVALVAALPREDERLLEVPARRGQVAEAEAASANGCSTAATPWVSPSSRAIARLSSQVMLRLRVAPHPEADLAGVEQRPGARRVARLRARARQRLDRHAVAEPEQAADDPVAPQRRDEPQAELAAASAPVAPRVRGQQVLALEIEPREPRALLARPTQLRVAPPRPARGRSAR